MAINSAKDTENTIDMSKSGSIQVPFSARSVSKPKKRSKTPVRGPRKRKKSSETKYMHALIFRLVVLLVASLVGYMAWIYVFSPFRSKWLARYGEEIYPDGYSIRGIDISHHQGEINWEKLSKATIGSEGVCFVFIKATEGENFMDENFNENFYEAREYGMIRGAYHYFNPSVPAKIQAEYYLKQVHLEAGDLPPVLDIEERGTLSVEKLQKAAREWLDIVEHKYNVPPILYTNYKFKEAYLSSKEFERYPYWIAHYYVRNLTYKGQWKFWQHTDCGRLQGINEKVDLNIYNGSMYDLKRLCLPDTYE